jgi:hypothetical protein
MGGGIIFINLNTKLSKSKYYTASFFFCSTYTLSLVGKGSQINIDTIKVSKLFSTHDNLALKLSLYIKDIKKETNDSTFTVSKIAFLENDGSWQSLVTEIRVRGNLRLYHCYFPPLKLKISTSERKGTIFKGNKKLKLVLPCSNTKSGNDYVVKEYLTIQTL